MKLIGYVEFIVERSKVYAMWTNTYRKLFKREEYGLLILKGNQEFKMGWRSDECQLFKMGIKYIRKTNSCFAKQVSSR